MTAKHIFILAGISGALCVALGAMGAHGLETRVNTKELSVFKTAALYHFFHTLALFVVGMLLEKHNTSLIRISAYLFIAGIILFSGSLYVMSVHQIVGFGELKKLGVITPFGGLSFILGWLFISFSFIKKQQ